MPTPHKGEKEKDFINRCIPIVLKEGTAKDQKQAVAICYSIWRQSKGKKEMENIQTGLLTRTAYFEREKADKESRSIPLSFSSEEPIERFFGIEILNHDSKSVRMDRASKGLPLLVNHDRDKQAGIIEDVSISTDRRGRGLARFGKSVLAEEIFTDVLDGIRKDVSVGYRIHKMVLEKEEDEIATYRATDWEPLEVSIVAVPADITVGIGRGEGTDYEIRIDSPIKEVRIKMEKCPKCGADLVGGVCYPCREKAALEQEREKEKLRVSDIMKMGQEAGLLDKAIEYVREGKTLAEFSQIVIASAREKLQTSNVKVGKDLGEDAPWRNFAEYLYCVRFAPADPRLKTLFNDKVGEKYIQAMGQTRAMSMGVGTAGGFAVPTQFRPDFTLLPIPDAIIRPRATIIPAGDPPDSAVEIPSGDQGTTHGMYCGFSGQWINEGGTKPETNLFLKQITLEPHEWAATLIVTDKLLRNWDACATFVETNARRAMGAAEENAFLTGNGIGKPLGFINIASDACVKPVTRNGANAIAWVDVYTMYARLYGGRGVWIASPTTKTQLIPMKDDASGLVWHPNAREGEPTTLMGLPLFFYDRSPALGSRGDLVLVDLSYYLIKDGSGPFFGASDQVYYTTNKTVFKIFFNVDGQPAITERFPVEGGASTDTVSPFVILV